MVGDGVWQVTGIALAHAADALSFSWLLIHFHNLVFLLPIQTLLSFSKFKILKIINGSRVIVWSFPFPSPGEKIFYKQD